MNEIERKLGFDFVINKLKKLTLSSLGISKIEKISFSNNLSFVRTQLKLTAEFLNIIENEDFPLDYISDLRQQIEALNKKYDAYLQADDILKLGQNLKTIKNILNFFKNDQNREKYPELAKLAKQIKFYPAIISLIDRIITKEGEIRSSASKELKKIREQLATKEKQISSVVRKIWNYAHKAGIVDNDDQITVRNGKMLIPVKVANKNKLKGVIQDYSASGMTAYIEPLESIELNNEIRDLRFAERREIIKILIDFTNDLRPYVDDLKIDFDFLADIDFIRSKALLAKDLNATMPNLSEKPLIRLRNAFHPLLLWSYRETGKKVVPLDLDIDEKQRILLISGPNAGGKSIAIKTVGLLQYMTQCGLLTPVRENSIFGIFEEIFVDIGDDQSIENDLSTYSSHLKNMKNILLNASHRSLVLIDEFGAGTDPALGGAIAEAILEELLKKHVKAVINTHYSNLKYFAEQNEGIINAAMLFDQKTLRPLYLLETGRPGSSFAFEIAKNIGLPNAVIDKAKEKTGENTVNFDKIITELALQSRRLRDERNEIQRLKKDLSQKITQYKTEREKLLKNQKQIINNTKQEFEKKLADLNKTLENTIKEIRTQKPDNQRIKQLRKRLQDKHSDLKKDITNKQTRIDNDIQKLKKNKHKDKKIAGKIEEGDTVEIIKNGLKGEVEEIKDEMAMLRIGHMRTFVKLTELRKIASSSKKKQTVKVNIELAEDSPKNFVFGIDVRGKSVDEALQRITKYIDNAIIADAREVKILHGTGNGILRTAIRQYLKTIDEVEWFGDEDIRLGGAGITVVKFKT